MSRFRAFSPSHCGCCIHFPALWSHTLDPPRFFALSFSDEKHQRIKVAERSKRCAVARWWTAQPAAGGSKLDNDIIASNILGGLLWIFFFFFFQLHCHRHSLNHPSSLHEWLSTSSELTLPVVLFLIIITLICCWFKNVCWEKKMKHTCRRPSGGTWGGISFGYKSSMTQTQSFSSVSYKDDERP